MWDIKYLIQDYLRSNGMQDFINRRYKDWNKIIINPKHFQKIITEDGYTFDVDDEFNTWKDIFDEYHYDDIRPDDIVVDIGANVGAFTHMAYRRCQNVTCVEPIKVDKLMRNIAQNNLSVKVIPKPFGDGSYMDIVWLGNRYSGPSVTWQDILNISGGCTWLKCDCEGGEWFFTIDDLKNIRRIEMEVHHKNLNGEDNSDLPYINQLAATHTITKDWILNNDSLYILHATRRFYFESKDNKEFLK